MGVTANKQNEENLCGNKTVPSLNWKDAYTNPQM